MERIDTATPDLTQENIDRIAELFPDVVTEAIGEDGELRRAIDFDALRGDLADEVVDGQRERYQFTWPGKAAAKLEARTPCDKTLRPCIEESKDWDTTQNLYIEGDNLDALKLLRETYAGKVKLIYIDPPYNTGHDFIYDDNFSQSREDYEGASDEYDEEGGRLVANPESNGRFHSDWCSMMYPRLLLARDILTNDGSIFISIDDNELENLKKICEEVFGACNFVANVVWKHTQQSKNDEYHFSRQYNHMLVYAKDLENLPEFYFERTAEDNRNYSNPDNDPKGLWRSGDVRSPNYRRTLCFTITAPDGSEIQPPVNGWRWSSASIANKIETGEIVFKPDNSGIIRKIYLADQKGRTPENLWDGERFGTTRQAAAEIKTLFDGVQVFDTPKPHQLIQRICEIAARGDDIVLDFFAGSGSTAQGVLTQNLEDGYSRTFILVQFPEKCNKDSGTSRIGYETISDICKERIRRAGDKIVNEIEAENYKLDGCLELENVVKKNPIPDIGFRVLKIDSPGFNDTYRNPEEFSQDALAMYVDNLKEGRTPEDLLFQVLPKFRIPLSAKIDELDLCGKRVFDVNDGQMLACFDAGVGIDTIEAIARRKPVYAVFRDASMADDSTEANFEELFKTFSPDTIRRVI